MIIQITPDGFIHLSGDAPEVGRKYLLEDATEGTQAQNRAFHALVQEYFTSGCHSYNAKTWLELGGVHKEREKENARPADIRDDPGRNTDKALFRNTGGNE